METARWSKGSDGLHNPTTPNRVKVKGIFQKYNSSNSLHSVRSRPCLYVSTYACFFAAVFFILLAGVRQVVDDPQSHFGRKGGSNVEQVSSLAFPLIEKCDGRRVYMYDLPPEFNVLAQETTKCNHSLLPWMDLCSRFVNGGFGVALRNSEWRILHPDSEFDDSEWYETDFYMLEVIFHTRMKSYRCLTRDALKADAFYVPHYTGILALSYLYHIYEDSSGRPYEERQNFGKDLIDWLESNGGEAWRRHGGKDHFLTMGRTTWDFKLAQSWGTGFSGLPHVANMTSLIIESFPWPSGEQAIPYATVFHPASPQRLQRWIETVVSAKRRYLFSYVGAPRIHDSWSVRGIMTSSCLAAGEAVCRSVDCSEIRCSHDPVPAYKLFLQSYFCLQPRGDTPTRRSTFDCLISGAIPVFFHKESAYTQYSWHLPRDSKSYSVYIDEEDLKSGVSIEHVLRSYSQATIETMQKTIVSMIPNLLYFDCRKDGCSSMTEMDAFDVTMTKLFEKIEASKNDLNTL